MNNMNYMESWAGNKKEVGDVANFLVTHIKNRHDDFDDMSDKNLRKLFLQALLSNIVVEEIYDMMVYYKKEYEDN